RLAGTPARLSLPAGEGAPPIEAAAAAIGYAAGELRLEGGPASLSYPDAESGELLAATAASIVYAEEAGTIVMEGGAQAQLGSESIASELITFDAASGAFSAAPAEGERVKATIKLRQ
ncbi:MAG: hypothetical protein ISN26_05440, partial [Betaproteobacteria bacterium AqS2]|nr:hypothetical protein [Betaproteobacteria bacterium AqS2]